MNEIDEEGINISSAKRQVLSKPTYPSYVEQKQWMGREVVMGQG
jgi:hypothetical protein